MDALIDFQIQGRSHLTKVGLESKVNDDIGKALRETGVAGGPGEWTARTEGGKVLDGNKSLREQGIGGPTKLILSHGPGRGG